MPSVLYAPTLLTMREAIIELISYSKGTEGNCAVIHMPSNTVTPWITVRNLYSDGCLGAVTWDHGFYFTCRRLAERKFYEMTGVLNEKTGRIKSETKVIKEETK